MDKNEKYYTIREAAQIFNVTEYYIRRLIAEKKLRAEKSESNKKSYMIAESELKRLAESPDKNFNIAKAAGRASSSSSDSFMSGILGAAAGGMAMSAFGGPSTFMGSIPSLLAGVYLARKKHDSDARDEESAEKARETFDFGLKALEADLEKKKLELELLELSQDDYASETEYKKAVLKAKIEIKDLEAQIALAQTGKTTL